MTDPNPLWQVIQAYMDDPKHRYSPTAADLARETKVSDQVISKWKKRPTLPTPDQLMNFARGTGIDYLDLLEAALEGRGYLPAGGAVRMSWRGQRSEHSYWFLRPNDADEHPGARRLLEVAPEVLDPAEAEQPLAARRVAEQPGLARQADEQDADAYAPDPEGPEGGA